MDTLQQDLDEAADILCDLLDCSRELPSDDGEYDIASDRAAEWLKKYYSKNKGEEE